MQTQLTDLDKRIESLIRQARNSCKHDWQTYEFFKNQVIKMNLGDCKYEEVIRRLIGILEV